MTGGARIWIQRVLAAVLLLTVLAGTAFFVVWNTEAGARWALRQVGDRAPGQLEVAGLDGTLRQGLRLERVTFEDAGRRIEARGVQLALDWPALWDRRLIFTRLQAEAVEIRQPEPGPDPEPFEVAMEPVPLAIFSASGQVGQLSLRKDGPLADIRGVHWSQLAIEGQIIRAAELAASAAGYSATASGPVIELRGKVPLSMDLEWRADEGGWSGSGPVRGDLAELRLEQQVTGPYPADVRGAVRLLGRVEPVFEASVAWSDWNVAGYPLREGEVQLTGVPENYTASYRFELESPEAGAAQVSGTARGDLEGLGTVDARIETASGSASASGQLSWTSPWSTSAQVTLAGLDPSLFHPALSGSLQGETALAAGEEQPLRLSNLDLEGQLNGSPFSGRGDLEFAGQSLECRQCDLSLGRNRLRLDGTLGREEMALSVEADAPALDAFWPGLAGRLEAQGLVDGSPSLPRFRGSITGRALEWQEWSAEQLEVQSRGAGSDLLDLDFSLSGVVRAERPLGQVTGVISGKIDDLTLDLDWMQGETEASVSLSMATQGDRGKGVLRSANVEDPFAGSWHLQQSAAFTFGPGQWQVDPIEWRGGNGMLRVDRFEFSGGELAVMAELEQLPLKLFEFVLPGGMTIAGTAGASVDLNQAGERWSGSVHWRQQDTVLAVEQFDGEMTEVEFPVVSMEAQLADGGATIMAAVTVEPGVTGYLDMALDALSPDAHMEAELRLQGREWEWIPVLVPQVDRIAGVMDAQFRANGPLNSPGLSGQLRWTEGSLVVPALNVPLTGVEILIEGAPQAAATVTGHATAGNGTLELDGTISKLLQADREVQLRLTGNSAELLNWPEYRVWGSPDLELLADREGWNITGDLHLTRADIAVEEAPEEAVTPSPDVVVVGAEPDAEESADYAGEVRLHLGENVRVRASGLDTRLEGELLLRQVPDRPMRAEGRVDLAEGVFEAYGQKLTIEEGTLTFTGPLDNPLVDVRAVREVDAFAGPVTAGIHLTGRAKSINSTVYSEPAMPEAEALSYLVLGQPLDQATSSEGSQLSNAALSLGLRQANRITGQIARNVGLDQLTLTADGGEGTALVAGKQINSRLYARYAYGVFSRLGTLLLRYRLSQRLTLEAGTGENQSIDLLYTVEKY